MQFTPVEHLITIFERDRNALLKVVTWQEALAWACAELLGGNWARNVLSDRGHSVPLWPSPVSASLRSSG
jgi:hypothetical protein